MKHPFEREKLWWWRREFDADIEKQISSWHAESGIVTHGLTQEWRIFIEPAGFAYEYARRATLIEDKGPFHLLEFEKQERWFFAHDHATGACEEWPKNIKARFTASPQELVSRFQSGQLVAKSPRKKAAPWSVVEAMDLNHFEGAPLSDSARGKKSKVDREVKALIDRIKSEGFSILLP